MKVDPQRPVPVKVMGVTGSSLMVHEQFGDKGIPLEQIQNVQMPPPPEVLATPSPLFESRRLRQGACGRAGRE